MCTLNVQNYLCFLKNYEHFLKIVYVECIESCTFIKNLCHKCTKLCKFFEIVCTLNAQNCVYSLKNVYVKYIKLLHIFKICVC